MARRRSEESSIERAPDFEGRLAHRRRRGTRERDKTPLPVDNDEVPKVA
jgi:hypothetical protein